MLEQNKKKIEESKLILKEIEKKEIIFIRNASDNGQLYGSVSPKDIANYFNEKKISIRPSNINLHSSIKKIGIYDLSIKLHAEVGCNLKINVATSEENAKKQKIESETLIKKSNESKKSVDNNQNDDVNKSKVKMDDKISKTVDKSKEIIEDSEGKSNDLSNENKAIAEKEEESQTSIEAKK